jgi:hypothetical protein
MTIRKGEPWGRTVDRPTELTVAASDRQLASLVADRAGQPLGVSNGDVFRTVGAPGERPEMVRLPMDLLRVEADGRRFSVVAHVVARRSWWHGGIVAVMNVDHVGVWNVAPRAHPNDGRFDVLEVDRAMTIRQRLQARGRLVQGTHVPHPRIATRTAAHSNWVFDRPQRLWLDGEHVGSVRALSVEIEPDAFAVHV